MPSASDIRKSVHDQISELQDQIHTLRSSLSDQGSDYYDAAGEQARIALKRVKAQARAVGAVAREQPATTATVLSIVALTCLGLGYIAGRAGSSDDHW